MNNHLTKPIISSSSCLSVIKDPIPDIIHGRVTEYEMIVFFSYSSSLVD